MTYGYPQPPAPHMPPPPPQNNGIATAGMILGILAATVSLIPILNIIVWPLAIVGIVLAAVGLNKATKTGKGKGQAIAGLITAIASLALFFVINAAFVDAVDDEIKKNDTSSSAAETPSTPEDIESPSAAEDTSKDTKNKEKQKEKEAKPPILLTAEKAPFKPTVLHEGSNYTSVKVTVTNHRADETSVNPLYFEVTDTNSERHSADFAQAEDGIKTVELRKGEKATGTVTFEGKFTPAKIYFTDSGFGTDYSAPVK